MTTGTEANAAERADLREFLAARRFFLEFTARDLTDEQAAQPDPETGLSVGGLIKHVTRVERAWAEFAQGRPGAISGAEDEDPGAAHLASFVIQPGETLAALVESYHRVAAETDRLVDTLDLDAAHPLPPAPWFAPGATRTVRGAFLHIAGETAQHAGHADQVRERIDGAKTMG